MARSNSHITFIGGAIASAFAITGVGWNVNQEAIAVVVAQGAVAQPQSPCAPPAANEYLLMVVYRSPQAHDQLTQALPRNTTTTVCDYLGTTVTRVGGFTDLEVANSWAQFLSDVGGLQAFVARPPEANVPPTDQPVAPEATQSPTPQPDANATATPPFPSPGTPPDANQPTPGATASELAPAPFPQPTPTPATQPSPSPAPQATPTPGPATDPRVAYNPQALGTGYAVLVDYFNRPEVATQLQQVITTPVGLVSYEQRPYLLATYTSDLTAAAAVLQTLSDRNFSVVIVDSRRAVLLTPRVVTD
ncbi:hypothetical protein H6G89_30910 [Oscillatoria sp. FACHB-1407]|uniref:hypothetical protein n=1 Tax=Oscillatoria sp. FACHB-1407 TaxID=2692847 RepID=UPI00168875F8|nr:hypothetical protein [Oscillatoria sp. FACHB-1407]MBD2465421.1 hypothetical protein [Oscillatoria sp. FACHB-1407]